MTCVSWERRCATLPAASGVTLGTHLLDACTSGSNFTPQLVVAALDIFRVPVDHVDRTDERQTRDFSQPAEGSPSPRALSDLFLSLADGLSNRQAMERWLVHDRIVSPSGQPKSMSHESTCTQLAPEPDVKQLPNEDVKPPV